MPWTQTAKSWGAGTPQPNSLETNPGSNTHRHAAFCQADTAPGESVAQAKNASDTDFSHADLLKRLSTALAGSNELDFLIEKSLHARGSYIATNLRLSGNLLYYTTSVDDALAFVPDGWSVLEISECVTHYRPGIGWFCSLKHRETEQVVAARSHTLPLAICIACLRASVGEGR